MAIKYFCDGCDHEIRHSFERTQVTITFDNDNGTNECTDILHLCKDCANKVNPKKWPRSVKARMTNFDDD